MGNSRYCACLQRVTGWWEVTDAGFELAPELLWRKQMYVVICTLEGSHKRNAPLQALSAWEFLMK